jgi:MFS family permease
LTASPDKDPESGEWRRGWRVLLSAATGVGVGIPAVINSAGLFVIPLQQDFGWSRRALAIGPIVGLVYSCSNPIGGMLTDRFGSRRVATAGLILLSAGLLLLAAVPANPLAFYATLVALGLIGTTTNNVVYCKAVATWFERNAGTAIALVLSGVSLVGAALQPGLSFIIVRYGWRIGYVCLAASTLVLGLPMVLTWFKERLEPRHARGARVVRIPGASVGQALRDRRFWLIVAAFGGAALPIGGFVNQLQPLLVNKGYSPVAAANLVAVFLFATALGRLAAGFLFDHRPPSLVAAAFLLFSGLGALILGLADLRTMPWLSVATAISLVGLAQGAEGDFIALFALRIFGLRHFSTLFATIATASGIGFALGGVMFAAIFDLRGDYGAAALSSAAILLLTAILAATIKVPAAREAAKSLEREEHTII